MKLSLLQWAIFALVSFQLTEWREKQSEEYLLDKNQKKVLYLNYQKRKRFDSNNY